jgi:type IV pilus assembly protein PilW
MKSLTQHPLPVYGGPQRGFTLVELMITVAIAMFLLFGLFSIVQNVRVTYANQQLLAQLEDAQRLAMIMMTDVTQEAGYFPNPATYSASDLPAVGVFAVGQAVSGTHPNGLNPPGDTLAVRYMSLSGDGMLNCHGTQYTGGGTFVYTNTFSIVGGQLMCDPGDGTGALPLVTGVTNLQVMYGVKRNTALAGNDVDTYLTASQMLTTDWPNLTSVTITLTFVNPLAATTGTTASNTTEGVKQPATLSFTRVIDVMNRAGEGAT